MHYSLTSWPMKSIFQVRMGRRTSTTLLSTLLAVIQKKPHSFNNFYWSSTSVSEHWIHCTPHYWITTDRPDTDRLRVYRWDGRLRCQRSACTRSISSLGKHVTRMKEKGLCTSSPRLLRTESWRNNSLILTYSWEGYRDEWGTAMLASTNQTKASPFTVCLILRASKLSRSVS